MLVSISTINYRSGTDPEQAACPKFAGGGRLKGNRPVQQRFLQINLALIILSISVMVLGPLVRAEDAGLACPDWPLCFGRFLPDMDYRIFLEWLHRAVAGLLSLLFLGWFSMTVWLPQLRRRYLVPILLAGLLLVLQVILGALTVTLQLQASVVNLHLLNSILFVSLLVYLWRLARTSDLLAEKPNTRENPANSEHLANSEYLANSEHLANIEYLANSEHLANRENPTNSEHLARSENPTNSENHNIGETIGARARRRSFILPLFILLLVFVQLFLGGRVSSHEAGRVCNAFPACYFEPAVTAEGREYLAARYFPPMTGSIEKHITHRLMAYLLFLAALLWFLLTWQRGRSIKERRQSALFLLLMLAQIAVGALNVIYSLPVSITVLHSFLAYMIYLTMFIAFLDRYFEYKQSR